jgi:protein-tyrosine phosphatase
MKRLFSVQDMPALNGLAIPVKFYVVTDQPALLAGMYRPDAQVPWGLLSDKGYTDVFCLASETLGYDPAPLRQHRIDMEDLHFGNEPGDPKKEEDLVRETSAEVLDMIKNGHGVIVHCYGGNGRTGTVIGCTLKALGYPVDDIISYYDRLAKMRGRPGWPESPWQSRMVRDY